MRPDRKKPRLLYVLPVCLSAFTPAGFRLMIGVMFQVFDGVLTGQIHAP